MNDNDDKDPSESSDEFIAGKDKILNQMHQHPPDSEETFVGIGKHCSLKERRVFERRTRRDRRRVWKNPKFKSRDKRCFKRRSTFNRRHVEVNIDDLGKNIP